MQFDLCKTDDACAINCLCLSVIESKLIDHNGLYPYSVDLMAHGEDRTCSMEVLNALEEATSDKSGEEIPDAPNIVEPLLDSNIWKC
ncbi:hypothetical protein PVAP13_2NG493900 [Panicum virgatum]|uniref:Uncharacterized protein n=1 Tax=Panicum virgatum TaxID=38727 RepID=A0A8T0VUM1_PANVG|nr:hypothetical protein PVAP13_2NG493900 [Panicum virgatum]KAG2636915.1 hypothetical protein PVAP13_2NG493900 [Panicum virgatum]